MLYGILQKKRRVRDLAHALYLAAVARARAPEFFTGGGVPDTLDGRFDMIVLHVYLLVRRLRQGGKDADDISRRLLEELFADMDRSLREIGVGDLSVGRKVKQMAAAFFGRAAAYDRGLAAGDPELAEALNRNLYAGAGNGAEIDRMIAYLQAQDAHLTGFAVEQIGENQEIFGDFSAVLREPKRH